MNDTSATPHHGNGVYRVLARKYRPTTFEDLIGQDGLVRTLKNAFASGRIAQAYMLTGVRGIGKTTTARLIARALNHVGSDGDTGPSIDLSTKGEHCDAIMESRHVDVIEMDAASHTGVDNVREINDAVRYKPATARYKVYIIDEVHMLSTAAFNALLKTLEEPPPHAKFIFATTEIRKVPVTVLSRCQRFDLRRLDAETLIGHLASIAEKENVSVEDEALRMIARAAEGSVRDGLSLLDQAIAYGVDAVRADDVQAMLGLSDRARIIDLFEELMRGDAAAALANFEAQHAHGADPEAILQDLASFVHLVTKTKVSAEAAEDAALTPQERERGTALAGRLAMPVLARAWQMLLKGMDETARAGQPFAAAEMVLIRLAHAADMPPPEELARLIRGTGTQDGSGRADTTPDPPAAPSAMNAPATVAPDGPVAGAAAQRQPDMHEPELHAAETGPEADRPGPVLTSFEDVVAHARAMREIKLVSQLERCVVPVAIGPGRLEIALTDAAPAGLANDLSRRLEAWTGQRWMVLVSAMQGGRTLADTRRDARDALFRQAREDETVRKVLDSFPGAEIVDVRELSADTDGADDDQPETNLDRDNG